MSDSPKEGRDANKEAVDKMSAAAPELASVLARLHYRVIGFLIGQDETEDELRKVLDEAESVLHRAGHWKV